MPNKRGALFIAAAALPCVVMVLFCVLTIHEWWLIASEQVAVIPSLKPGQSSAEQVPASRLLPFAFVSGALAAVFAWAIVRNSRRALVGGYVAILLIVGQAWLRHQ